MRVWTRKEWEARVDQLLRLHYQIGEYQTVPDAHRGDFGVEGFSTDGCAYQAYSPDEPLSIKERYEKQRDKITADINKFINNADELAQLFDGTVIRRWILVVPRHDSARLIQHAKKKAKEVHNRALPYVSDDFEILVITDAYFERERAQLDRFGLDEIRIEVNPSDGPPIEELEDEIEGLGLLDNLHTKTEKLPTLTTEAKRREFRSEMARNYLIGQKILGEFQRSHPTTYQVLVLEKRAREGRLRVDTLVSGEAPGERLSSEIQLFADKIEDRLPHVHSETRNALALEAVSDWLLRCPLDFPDLGGT